ncbi:MAG: N-6 DNA methylase [Bacteroidales bacterium]|nr:N-6 DNA methylase [Bacteroidales bacterium]
MTLHEAIKIILTEAGRPMKASDIAGRINQRGLYRRKDEQPVPASQVTARVGKYEKMFASENGLISLLDAGQKELEAVFNAAAEIFRDRWHQANPRLLMASLFFYKRILDCPEIRKKYLSNIEGSERIAYQHTSEAFHAFYRLLEQSGQKDIHPGFPLLGEQVLENNKYLILEHINEKSPLEETLEELENHVFSIRRYSIEEFGSFFEYLLHQVYSSIRYPDILTPPSLRELLVHLGDPSASEVIYTPMAGYYGIPAMIRRMTGKEVNFYGEEKDQYNFLMGLMNLVMNDLDLKGAYFGDAFADFPNLGHPVSMAISVMPEDSVNNFITDDQGKKVYADIRFDLIRKVLDVLDETGRAILVVGDDLLSDNKPEVMELKEYLLKKNFLEGIISLPYRTMFASRHGESIMILNKRKVCNKVIFLDADQADLYAEKHGYSVIKSRRIAELYNSHKEMLTGGTGTMQLVEDPFSVYGNEDAGYYTAEETIDMLAIAGEEEIKNSGYNLLAKRHVGVLSVFEAIQNQPVSFIQLKKLFIPLERKHSRIRGGLLPLITKEHLKPFADEYPVIRSSELEWPAEEQSGKLVSTDSILVSRSSGKLAPTLLLTEGREVLIDQRIERFEIDLDKVDPFYLLLQMKDSSFREQFKAYSPKDRRMGNASLFGIPEMYIPYPSLEEQRKFVAERKAAILKNKIQSADKFAKTEQIRYNADKEILRMLKHELTPLGEAIEMNIETLKKYISRLNRAGKPPDFNDPASAREASRSVEELFSVLLSDAAGIKGIISDLQKIIDANREDLHLSSVSLNDLIQRIAASYSQYVDFELIINDDSPALAYGEIMVDEGQFRILLDNFFKNSLKHGFGNDVQNPGYRSGHENFIIFKISHDENTESLCIDMINNGKPFPEEFSFEDFITLGSYAGNGTGIGGYLMHKIVLNHGGLLEMIEPGRELVVNVTDPTRQGKPQSRSLKPGVHFRITIPFNTIRDE